MDIVARVEGRLIAGCSLDDLAFGGSRRKHFVIINLDMRLLDPCGGERTPRLTA